MTPPYTPGEDTRLRNFIRSTSLGSTHLAYIPAYASTRTLPLEPSTAERSTSSKDAPRLIRSASFANLLQTLRWQTSPSPSPPTTCTDAVADQADQVADPTVVNTPALGLGLSLHDDQAIGTGSKDRLRTAIDVPTRSSSLSWARTASPSTDTLCASPRTVIDDLDGAPYEGEDFAAELQKTFLDWEAKFARAVPSRPSRPEYPAEISFTPHTPGFDHACLFTPGAAADPLSPESVDTHLGTPEPYADRLSPLSSRFSCDSEVGERSIAMRCIDETPRSTPTPGPNTPASGTIGRLRRKISNALLLGLSSASAKTREHAGLGPGRERRGTA